MADLLNEPENKVNITDNDKELIPMGPKAPGISTQGLIPISHKDFNVFIKGKGFVGRNNYKLRELKAMFGFKPLTYKNQATVTIDDGKQFRTFESISKASIGSGIPYTTLIQVRKKCKLAPKSDDPVPIRSGGNIYVIRFNAK